MKVIFVFSLGFKLNVKQSLAQLSPSLYLCAWCQVSTESDYCCRFTAGELKLLYRGFKTECPTGILTEESFHNIYTSFFPWGEEPYHGETDTGNTDLGYLQCG